MTQRFRILSGIARSLMASKRRLGGGEGMFCPQCKAEYRPGFTQCADCDVDLVWELPQEGLEPRQRAQPGDPNEDPFCSFWKGEDPRVHAELCSVLDEAEIPPQYRFPRRSPLQPEKFSGV